MAKKVKMTIPDYVKDFKCIGGSCEDSCCIGWDIDIDKITYRSYFRTKNESMKKRFKEHVYMNRACDSEDVDYGRVKIRENHWCPFLNEEKLCDIYTELGEEYLSNVCTSYPRVLNIVDNTYEMSLFMSCPEAARKLLMDDRPIRWCEQDIPLEKFIVHSYIDTRDSEWKNSPIKKLTHLRQRSLDIMGDRGLTITERLSLLGDELEKQFAPKSNQKSNEGINGPLFTFGILKEMIGDIGDDEAVDSQSFLHMAEQVKSSFKLTESVTLKEQAASYMEARVKASERLKQLEPMIEKYLINFMYQANFPFTENQSVFDGYVMLVMRFAFLRFFLVGQLTHDQSASREELVRSIQVFTKTIEHHHHFMRELLNYMHLQEFNRMSILKYIIE